MQLPSLNPVRETIDRLAKNRHCRGSTAPGDLAPVMTQTQNRILDELAKMMTDAAGAAQGLRREIETVIRSQGEKWLREMDVVSREEHEAVRAMAEKARLENERQEARILALEAALQAMKEKQGA
jgi:BMFP domain-containing protein YqiC